VKLLLFLLNIADQTLLQSRSSILCWLNGVEGMVFLIPKMRCIPSRTCHILPCTLKKLSMTAPLAVGSSRPHDLAMGRAFALEGRGIWHALSLSAAQQVYGPMRARADLRFALEAPPAGPSEEPGRATLEGAWKVIMCTCSAPSE
jgi:hypothetical protein